MKTINIAKMSKKDLLARLKLSKMFKIFVCTLILILGTSVNISSANRFDPPSLKIQLNQFDSRIEGNIFNVDFLLAHIINNGRKTEREVGRPQAPLLFLLGHQQTQ